MPKNNKPAPPREELMSDRCLTEASSAFERAKVPGQSILSFNNHVLSGAPLEVTELSQLQRAAAKINVSPECRNELKEVLGEPVKTPEGEMRRDQRIPPPAPGTKRTLT